MYLNPKINQKLGNIFVNLQITNLQLIHLKIKKLSKVLLSFIKINLYFLSLMYLFSNLFILFMYINNQIKQNIIDNENSVC